MMASPALAETGEDAPNQAETVAAGGSASLGVAASAAQTEAMPDLEDTAFSGDFLTLGIGVAYGPSYEGSNDFVVFPAPTVVGSFGGVNFQTRGPGLAVDLIPDARDAKVGFVLGPVGRVRLDRTRQIEDVVVKRLGKLDTAIELGATAGVQVSRLLSAYDTLSATVDATWDVAGAHDGMVISPQISYFTPVSRSTVVTVSLSADIVDDKYADYYFSVSPAGSAASGLPGFQAEGGLKNISLFTLVGVDLDGEIANGGWAVFAAGGYSRLYNDFRASPIVSQRGDDDQVIGMLGIGYTF